MSFTPNSDALRSGQAAGRFDIMHVAVDNAVAMVDAAVHNVVIVAVGKVYTLLGRRAMDDVRQQSRADADAPSPDAETDEPYTVH